MTLALAQTLIPHPSPCDAALPRQVEKSAQERAAQTVAMPSPALSPTSALAEETAPKQISDPPKESAHDSIEIATFASAAGAARGGEVKQGEVKALLDRVRQLIDQAKLMESHSASLPSLIALAATKVDEMSAREAERERAESDERAKRRAEAQVGLI